MTHLCEEGLYQDIDVEEKFRILAQKLRSSEITFPWAEIQRHRFKVDKQRFFVMEIAEPTIQAVGGYKQRYVIARVTPYEVKYNCANVFRVYHDEFTSYHLYNVTSKYLWDEVASDEAPNALGISRVNHMLQKIHDQQRTEFVISWIKELISEDHAYERIEDYLDDLILGDDY